jgi:PEP-CTERM motif-containing protein
MPKLKRLLLLVSLVAALAFVCPDVARADAFTLTNGQTVIVNYLTTFAGSHAVATFNYNQATKKLTVVLTNNSTDNNKLFSFGFNAPGMTQTGNASIAYGGGTTASFQNSAQSLQLDFGVNSTQGNDNAVLNEGESLTAIFTFTTGPNILNIDITKIHIGSLPANPDSQKPIGVPNGFITLPEPTSMLLLGTGIAGVAAVFRRRRKSA